MITVNDQRIIPTVFPDGTQQVWQLAPTLMAASTWHISWSFAAEAELMTLVQLCDLGAGRPMHLALTYLPYGRQDKAIGNEATFGLHSFMRVLRLCAFDSITVMDPHSQVVVEALPHCRAIYPHAHVTAAIHTTQATAIAYPDAGAVRKYTAIYQTNCRIISGRKVRNQQTGVLTDTAIEGDPSGQIVLIVDDICDGGRTFTALADALYTGGAQAVHLFVTHGLFSKGIHVLTAARIGRIFTAQGEIDTRSDTIAYLPAPSHQ
jgi:ribose-phosphate pyrophosphokinase